MKASLRYFFGVLGMMAVAGATSVAGPQGGQPTPSVESLAPTFGGIRADTRSSHDSLLSFTFPVEIAQILVKGGQKVKKGDLLVQGRDDDTRFQRDLQKSIAESDLDIKKSQVALDQAQVEFDGQKELREKKKGGQEIEFERAKAALEVRKVELEIAKLQYAQQTTKLNSVQAQLDRYAMKAPFDGVIDKIETDLGEVKRETEPVLRIVSTDPLRMDVSTPTGHTITLKLKAGDPAWVLMDLPGEPAVYQGTVVEVAPQASFEAGERRVRVELPNPQDWPAGVAAWVRFTPPEGEWAKRVTKTERLGDAGRGAAEQPLNPWALFTLPAGGRTIQIGTNGRGAGGPVGLAALAD